MTSSVKAVAELRDKAQMAFDELERAYCVARKVMVDLSYEAEAVQDEAARDDMADYDVYLLELHRRRVRVRADGEGSAFMAALDMQRPADEECEIEFIELCDTRGTVEEDEPIVAEYLRATTAWTHFIDDNTILGLSEVQLVTPQPE